MAGGDDSKRLYRESAMGIGIGLICVVIGVSIGSVIAQGMSHGPEIPKIGEEASAKEKAGAEAKDGAAKDGAAKDGAAKDGAAKDGAAKDGAAKEDGAKEKDATADETK